MTTLKQLKELKKLLPDPVGYRILIAMPPEKEKTDGGIFFTEEQRSREATASIIGYVMKLGPDAYQDKVKFPSGAWCKEGDWVMFRSYSGTRYKVKGQEFRHINDDTIDGVIIDPTLIERAF